MLTMTTQLILVMIVLRLGSICTGGPGLHSPGAHLKTLIIVIYSGKKGCTQQIPVPDIDREMGLCKLSPLESLYP